MPITVGCQRARGRQEGVHVSLERSANVGAVAHTAAVTVSRAISRRYPHCITVFMRHRVLVDADYHLNGVGRAIAYTRIAAQELQHARGAEKVDYHAYAGVSAARTAIDSMASWVNLWYGLNLPPSSKIDLGRKDFRKKLDLRVPPAMVHHLDRLNSIGVGQIDTHRQRAQHREGLAVVHYPDGWYLAPEGIQNPRANDLPLPELLKGWADEIQAAVCDVLEAASEK